ncbi:MAG TPA: ATP-dependent Clp protease ATP-binding subunit [Chloroflexota bacterium]|nr:ATP-dependent Clp protease ATP-binding subunit [Chloroflexota bacterium]
MAELRTSGLSPEAVRALDMAAVVARNSGHHTLTGDHLATALLKQGDGLAAKLLRTYFGADLFELRSRLDHVLKEARTGFTPGELTHRYGGESFDVAPEVDRIVEHARRLAVQQRKPAAGTDHLLAALLEEETPARRALEDAGVAAARVQAASADVPLPPPLAARHGQTAVAQSTSDGQSRDDGVRPNGAVTDLVEAVKSARAPKVVERPALLQQLANLLVQPQTSVVLLGETGVGRRSLITALAQLIARAPLPGIAPALYVVSPAALLDGPELVVRQALERAQGGIVALPDLHQFFGAAPLTGFVEAGVALKQAILDGRVRVLGTSTPPLATRYLEADPALRDHLRPLTVPPATDAETQEILAALKPALEAQNSVAIADGALKATASLSKQYIQSPQPGAAVSLLQRACALVRLSQTAAFGSAPTTDSTVDDSDVAQALSQQTGIPIGQIAGQEQDRLARMEEILHQRVVGQDAAISALARAVRRARAGLKDPKRPIGSFLFLGPSGVGKTESALALAEFLFGAEDAVVMINMSEYMEKHNVARLIGAPPGYVGYEEGGQLTEKVRQKPYSVVVLDEVEKAHPDVYDLFLQVLDQGQLQDSRGRVVSFRNTVIVMTSNLGTRALAYPQELPAGIDPKQAVMQAVRDHFRPEFLNRLDGVIVFDPLDRAALGKILDLTLAKTAKQLAAQGIALDVTPDAREWLLEQHTEPEYGARPLIRIVQTHVKDAVAEKLIDGTLMPGKKVEIGLNNGALDLRSV